MFGFINFLFNENKIFYQLSIVTIDRQINLIIMTQASKFYEENIFLFFLWNLVISTIPKLESHFHSLIFDDE
jgi:hypothetical protein